MKNVITVIVTYNRKEILKENLKALDNCEGDNYIFIVDNGSTDGTKEYISDFLKDEEKYGYYRSEKNEGATWGFNQGIKQALRIGSKYIWIMDDDCIVKKDTLLKFLEADEKLNGDYGFLSSRVNWIDGNPCNMNIQKISFTKKISRFDENYQKIILASFVSLFLKTDVIKELGLPIKDFYIWTDDWEYTRRISRKYKCYYISNSIVTHKTAANIGASIENISNDRLQRCKYLFRNDYYLYRREGLKGKIYYWIRILYHKLKLYFSKLEDKKTRIKIIDDAIKEGKKFFPSIEYCFECYENRRVLILFAEPLSYGGQEAFMINMFSNYNYNNEYTFATPFCFDNKKLKEIIMKKNAKYISLNYSFNKIVRKINLKKGVKEILKAKKYEIVHIQSSSCFALGLLAKLCKKNGIKKVIVHSHCGGRNTLFYKMAKKYSDKNLTIYADDYLACSFEAAKWKFPQDIIKCNKYKIVKNGIDLSKFIFNLNDRYEIRKQLSIPNDAIVFCHVGRFAPEKNHDFFLKLIPLFIEKKLNFYFIFVGAGSLKNEFKKNLKQFVSLEKIRFLENIDYVNKIMSASDIFLMPSLSEGFPMVLVEAQANGLKTIFSNLITEECLITKVSIRLPLNENIWIEEIEKDIRCVNYDRTKYYVLVKNEGYDEKDCAHILETLYLG